MNRWVRSLRREKTTLSPWLPPRIAHEHERRPGGGGRATTTLFLVGKECPFSCVFCDLWQETLDSETPIGSLPQQLKLALDQISHRSAIKLYNASNFFDPAALPPEDDVAMIQLLDGFERVIVECHPRFLGARCFSFAERLSGTLEVAIGLETVHPDALPRLNKKMTVADFNTAAAARRRRQIGLRAFVLFGCPFIPAVDQINWTLRSVQHAASQGANTISIIPVRGGNGALEALATDDDWRPVRLDLVESVFERALKLELTDVVVQLDVWNLDRVGQDSVCLEAHECPECFAARRARLINMNRLGGIMPAIHCAQCAARRLGDWS
jgi:radical SAM enzyme (TIGR01210 family)